MFFVLFSVVHSVFRVLVEGSCGGTCCILLNGEISKAFFEGPAGVGSFWGSAFRGRSKNTMLLSSLSGARWWVPSFGEQVFMAFSYSSATSWPHF
jgi:hypothetical protein